MLGLEPRTLCILDKLSTTEPHLQPQLCFECIQESRYLIFFIVSIMELLSFICMLMEDRRHKWSPWGFLRTHSSIAPPPLLDTNLDSDLTRTLAPPTGNFLCSSNPWSFQGQSHDIGEVVGEKPDNCWNNILASFECRRKGKVWESAAWLQSHLQQ